MFYQQGSRFSLHCFMASMLALNSLAAVQADTPFDPLLRQISPEANVLVFIDSEQIRGSEFGRAQLQSKDAEAEHSQIIVRPEISQVLLGAKIRGFRESMIDWQTALLQMNVEPSVAGVAATYGGSIEDMGKTEYAVLPFGSVAVVTTKNVLAVLTPPDRQQVSRAVRLAGLKNPGHFTGYLENVTSRMTLGTGALIAVDLEEMQSKSQILNYLKNCETFRKPPSDILQAADVISSIRGLSLLVSFRSSAEAQLSIEFSQAVPDISLWGKELLIEILRDKGAYVEDVNSWTFSQSGKTIMLEGPVTPMGLHQIFSLLDFPTEVPSQYQPGATVTPEQERQRTVKATLTRFRATEKLIADLRKDDRARTARIGESALWFDRYARQIETLPSLHVDPDMLVYCDDVVMRLRVQATRYRMGSLKISQELNNPNYFWGYFNDYYGNTYSNWTRTESDQSRTRRYERAGAAGDRAEQFQAIDEDGTAIRRKMTTKYGVEF